MHPRIALTFLLCLAVVRDVSGMDAAALWADQVQALFDVKCINPSFPIGARKADF